jgi:hypothetical protein
MPKQNQTRPIIHFGILQGHDYMVHRLPIGFKFLMDLSTQAVVMGSIIPVIEFYMNLGGRVVRLTCFENLKMMNSVGAREQLDSTISLF